MAIEIYKISQLTTIGEELSSVLDSLTIPKESNAVRYEVSKLVIENLSTLRNDIHVVVETDYVDNVYRDSYYDYYATKRYDYTRNCVRLSFFDKEFDENVNFDNIDNIRSNYLGFLVLRPLYKCIGRNVISPKAKRSEYSNVVMNTVAVDVTCLGVKLKAVGFPHASQDGETMTCAQSTIWSLLEYFGNKYTCYHPTLPSEMEKVLENYSYERQLPSTGLTYNQISVALRQLGFGPKIYANPEPYNDEQFMENFACYIESGIPLAVAVKIGEGKLGHAVVCVGREKVQKEDLLNKEGRKLKEEKAKFEREKAELERAQRELNERKPNLDKKTYELAKCKLDIKKEKLDEKEKDFPNGKLIYSWNKAVSSAKFVFNDDNKPSYQQGFLLHPTEYYRKPKWNLAVISHFIAPLYSKIYMEANTANRIIKFIIAEGLIQDIDNESVVRTYLTSSRSYREYLITNPSFSDIHKKALLQIPLPKFVWVSEISDKDEFLTDKVNHLVLLDATGGKRDVVLTNILFLLTKSVCKVYDESIKDFRSYKTDFPDSFDAFKGNLK